MDARTVLLEWIGPDPDDETSAPPPGRRGTQGRLLAGKSPRRYHDDVLRWITFIEDTVQISAWRARYSHIETWLDSCGGAVRSRARRASALNAFYAYSVSKGYTTDNPVGSGLGGRPQDEPHLPELTEGQMELLRWGADQLAGSTAERDRLLMYLLLAGLRSRQITELTVQDLVFEQHQLSATVWQKGGGTRSIGFPDEIRAAVRAYLPRRTWRPTGSYEERGPLLVTYRGNPLDPNTTPRTILLNTVALALQNPDPEAPELPARITPDIVALTPHSPVGPLKDLNKS